LGGLLFLLLAMAGECHAASRCAATIRDLRSLLADQSLPLKWHETTMDDGKPLVLSILERGGSLFMQFDKTGEGLWAEGPSVVCLRGPDLEIHFVEEKLRLGPAANWITRYTFSNGGAFTLTKLGAERMRIATTGWSGTFSSREGE
jgi:hypothetical protein